MPQINRPASAFTAKTTQGQNSLSDYKRKWLMLFAHPPDFSPVCTTEFSAFANYLEHFKEVNMGPLGISIDNIHSHIAWTRSIKDDFGVEIAFPIIADLNMKVANAYGMIQPVVSDPAAVRAAFVIDPEGVLRATLYYSMTNGRSVEEVLRLVKPLQISDEYIVATPEAWLPGKSAIVSPPHTSQDVDARPSEGYEYTGGYFCKRTL